MNGGGDFAHGQLFDLVEEENGALLVVEGIERAVEEVELDAGSGIAVVALLRHVLDRVFMTAMASAPVTRGTTSRDGVEPGSGLLTVALRKAAVGNDEDFLGLIVEVGSMNSEVPEAAPYESDVLREQVLDGERRPRRYTRGAPGLANVTAKAFGKTLA